MTFPSEVLALYDNGTGVPGVTVVNAFTRISAPDYSDTGDYKGFNYLSDTGVPDVADIITTGYQYDYRAYSEYGGNDNPGLGASRGNLEREILAGNTHDFTCLHGRAIRAAGQGFVSQSAGALCRRCANICARHGRQSPTSWSTSYSASRRRYSPATAPWVRVSRASPPRCSSASSSIAT